MSSYQKINICLRFLLSASIFRVIETWNAKENIKGQVFDTPAVNTGVHTSVRQRLQEWLGRPILQLACRHHVGERHILHAYVACRGNQNIRSDENTLYKKIHKEWRRLAPLVLANPDQIRK